MRGKEIAKMSKKRERKSNILANLEVSLHRLCAEEESIQTISEGGGFRGSRWNCGSF